MCKKVAMDVFKRFMLFDKTVLVGVVSAKDAVNEAVKLHRLSRTATAALGRTLICSMFMAEEFKNEEQRLSVVINGGGPLGRIVAACDYGCKVRGYVENPQIELPLNSKGKLDVGGGVGRDGYISVIKDIGLKEPYSGRSPLVDGEIADDFAYYFTTSEQQPSAVAVGVLAGDDMCISAGGVFIKVLPDCDENSIVVCEDICRNFTNISELVKDFSVDEIIENNFGQFEMYPLPDIIPEYKCNCSKSKIEQVVISLGKDEAYDILKQEGKIEVTCQFCNKVYQFDKSAVDKLFL